MTVGSVSSIELRIVALLAEGFTNRQIAKVVHLAEDTVQRRLAVLMERAGAKNRPHLVLRACQMGWLTALVQGDPVGSQVLVDVVSVLQ